MTAPAAPVSRTSWRVRLIAVLPAVLLLAVQPVLLGLAQIAASPVSEDVPATALVTIEACARVLPAVALLLGCASALLALAERRSGRASGGSPWFLGFVPLVYLASRTLMLGRRGAGPLVLSLGLLAGGGAFVVGELALIVVIALQHSLPLS